MTDVQARRLLLVARAFSYSTVAYVVTFVALIFDSSLLSETGADTSISSDAAHFIAQSVSLGAVYIILFGGIALRAALGKERLSLSTIASFLLVTVTAWNSYGSGTPLVVALADLFHGEASSLLYSLGLAGGVLAYLSPNFSRRDARPREK